MSNSLVNPLQSLLKNAAQTLPATTGRVAAQQARINRRAGGTVILADISASMSGPAWGGQRKIDILREAVAGAQQQAAARLIVFSATAREERAIPEPEGSTNLEAGLLAAKAHAPGVTLVISDGHPDRADKALAVAATFRGVIDVLYIGPESDAPAIAFMHRLAAAAGGEVRMHDVARLGNAQALVGHIAGLLK